MIPNTCPGVVVSLRGRPRGSSSEVVAWDDDGGPLIIGRHGLVRPPGDDWTVVESGDVYRDVVPAPGWVVVSRQDGEEVREPVVGWGVRFDGAVEALVFDHWNGLEPVGFHRALWHPEQGAKELEEILAYLAKHKSGPTP